MAGTYSAITPEMNRFSDRYTRRSKPNGSSIVSLIKPIAPKTERHKEYVIPTKSSITVPGAQALSDFIAVKYLHRNQPFKLSMEELVDTCSRLLNQYFPYLPENLLLGVLDVLVDQDLDKDPLYHMIHVLKQHVGGNWKARLRQAIKIQKTDANFTGELTAYPVWEIAKTLTEDQKNKLLKS